MPGEKGMSEQTGKSVVSRELLQQALDALCLPCAPCTSADSPQIRDAIAALREALAGPQPEPVGQVLSDAEMGIGYDRRMGDVIWWNKPPGPALLYAASPAAPAPVVREPLTEAQTDEIWDRFEQAPTMSYRYLVTRAIERAHGIGGGGNG